MSEINKLLEIFNAEVGYLEKSKAAYDENPSVLYEKTAGAGKDNFTKYAKEMDELNVYNGPKQGYAWCNVFLDWCFVQAFGVDRTRNLLIGFSAGCTQDYNWFKSKGQIVNNPVKGDLVFFGDTSHVGIIEEVKDGKIYTIEGNTSNEAELIINGGTVAKKSYNLGSKYIHSYARPKYEAASDENSSENTSSNEIIYSTLQKGSKCNLVAIMQEKLINKGYRLPKFGPDGYFGDETEIAVRELQADAGIAVDGICGDDTWGVLNSDFVKPNAPAYPGYLIQKGQQSEDVRKVQARLIERGFDCGVYGADSIFGAATKNAVINFQKSQGLAVDGIVGPDTWSRLF